MNILRAGQLQTTITTKQSTNLEGCQQLEIAVYEYKITEIYIKYRAAGLWRTINFI